MEMISEKIYHMIVISVKRIFAHNLRKIRKERNLTQEQFAEIVETTLKTISDLENEKYLPVSASIDKICQNLNIMPGMLFQMSDEFVENEKLHLIKQIDDNLMSLDIKVIKLVHKMVSGLNK